VLAASSSSAVLEPRHFVDEMPTIFMEHRLASSTSSCSSLVSEVMLHFQWRTQKIFMRGFHSVAYGGHLYLVCALCDVTIWRHIHVSKPTFWRSLL